MWTTCTGETDSKGAFEQSQEYLENQETGSCAHDQGCLLKHQRRQKRVRQDRDSLQVQVWTGGQVSDMLPALLLLCVAGGVWGSAPAVWGYGRIQDRQGPAAPLCPSPCQCEEDGIFVMVDCSELGLSSVPTNLSPLTTYL